MPRVQHFEDVSMDAVSMRSRDGCSTVVPMPADVLFSCIAMLIWVRLEARPFHIPPRIALAGWSDCFECTNFCVGEGRCALPQQRISTLFRWLPFQCARGVVTLRLGAFSSEICVAREITKFRLGAGSVNPAAHVIT
jgi:hypothetical protein